MSEKWINWDSPDLKKIALPKEIQEKIDEFIEDITTLTITTKGKGNEQIVTNIKLIGDISSETTLEGDKLIEYHEKMTAESVNLIKTYAQLVIQTMSVFLPWAGIKLDSDFFKQMSQYISELSVQK
jgi:translation initiation factor 2 beta subunit (eIF-2beta)/eIF-5